MNNYRRRLMLLNKNQYFTIEVITTADNQDFNLRNFEVGVFDWGDESITYSTTTSITHTYEKAGTYTIRIRSKYSVTQYTTNSCSSTPTLISKVIKWGSIFKDKTYSRYMFSGCTSLTSIPSSWEGLDTIINCVAMIHNCTSLTSIPSSWEGLGSVTNSQAMLTGCTSLTSIPSSWTGFSIETTTGMFNGCTSLTSIPDSWSNFIVTRCDSMFSGCTSLTSIPSSWEGLSSVTNCSAFFSNCTSLISIPPSWAGLENVTTISVMFSGCTSLTSIPDSWSELISITECDNLFNNCISLITGGISGFSALINTISCTRMFYNDSLWEGNSYDLYLVISTNTTEGSHTGCFYNCVESIGYSSVPSTWKTSG